jgi:transposase
LHGLREVVNWMKDLSLSGIHQILDRFDISYKRGRQHVHSPDPLYDAKIAKITLARELAQQAPGHIVFLYEDEITVYKRPKVGRTYGNRSRCKGDKASGASSDCVRIAGCVDVASGAFIARDRGSYNVKEMYRFFYHIEQQYPEADIIYIALDNWPVHFHGYVKDHLAKIHSRIRFLPLPTYAPWTNPTEKVWLKLTREILIHHPYGNHWTAFKQEIKRWIADQNHPSAALLHEIGLLPDEPPQVQSGHCAPTLLEDVPQVSEEWCY